MKLMCLLMFRLKNNIHSNMTIRDIIREKSLRLMKADTIPTIELANELVELSALLSSLNAESVEKQFALNIKRRDLLEEVKSVAKARLLSEATIEWKEWYDRMAQREALEELIRSLKYRIRVAEEEYKHS